MRRLGSLSNLPQELLSLIFQRINDLFDLSQCLRVCTEWRSAAHTVLSNMISTPFFFCLKDDRAAAAGSNNNQILALSTKANYCLNTTLPIHLLNHTMHTSHRGWLLFHNDHPITTNPDNYYTLYNPITRYQIQLPPPPQGPFSHITRSQSLDHWAYVVSGELPPPDQNVFTAEILIMSTPSPRDPDCIFFALCLHLDRIAYYNNSRHDFPQGRVILF